MAHIIPAEAPVAVQYDLFAKVPNREIKLPLRLKDLSHAEYLLFNFQRGRPADLYGEENRQELEQIIAIINSDEFEVFVSIEGYYVMRRVAHSDEG